MIWNVFGETERRLSRRDCNCVQKISAVKLYKSFGNFVKGEKHDERY